MTIISEAAILSRDDLHAFAGLERHSFGFQQSLDRHPLLDLACLRDLAMFMQNGQLSYFFQNSSGQMSGWGERPRDLTLIESFDQLESGNVLIMLKSVHRHPSYARLLQAVLADLGDILGVDVHAAYRRPICTIIIASPGRITPYHVDDSHNLLMQVRGQKAFYVFDGSDPEVVTPDERKAFWNGDVNAARLTEAKQSKAIRYDLGPGSGVHVPFLYPHWAENGRNISVAISVNFQSTQDRALNVHTFNNFLRSRGLHPLPPGKNRLVDSSKLVAFRALSAIRGLTKPAL